ncbi:hypothetical protein GCM10010219_16760 [Streptomyces netropsis]|nr:hypothetical protein GCM10010219_16760 [Streptomyces netropsis]
MADHRRGVVGRHAGDGVGGDDGGVTEVDGVEDGVGDRDVRRDPGDDQGAAAEIAQQRVHAGAGERREPVQSPYDEVVLADRDRLGDADGQRAGQLLDGQSFGGAEEAGVAARAAAVGAALGDGVHDLDARRVRALDEPCDVAQGAGGAGHGGELGQCAVGADDTALALHGQEHGRRRVEPLTGLVLRRHGALLVGFSVRYGRAAQAPDPSRVRVAGIARRGKLPDDFRRP